MSGSWETLVRQMVRLQEMDSAQRISNGSLGGKIPVFSRDILYQLQLVIDKPGYLASANVTL